MTGQRIALLHFTAPPAIGGVEALLAAQAEILHANGDAVTLVAGSGEPSDGYRLVTIPELHPTSAAARAGRRGRCPGPDHPLARQIASALLPVLAGQDQIWVHNAFTVYLNPFLTVALRGVLGVLNSKRWVAFCHDLSAASRYVDVPDAAANFPSMPHGVRYVVLSAVRRQELAALSGISDNEIVVIPPPIDAPAWLEIGDEARQIAAATRLPERDLTILVPSKLLPHKRVELAMEAVAALKGRGVDTLLLVTGASSPHEPEVSQRIAHEIRALGRHLGVEEHICLMTNTLDRAPARETVRDLMSLCDLVYLPSAEEGYGIPISEAIALRVPVLCSDIPAFRETGEGYATYVDVDDTMTVAEAMRSIACAPDVVRRHDVMRSMTRFREALLRLVREP